MAFPATTAYLTLAMVALPAAAFSAENRVSFDGFAIDRTEVTIAQFRAFAKVTGVDTAAERDGGGFKYGAGWERRLGWSFQRPFGENLGSEDEPSVHVSWSEAQTYCTWRGGRLPTRKEWTSAAYTEQRSDPNDGFIEGTTYRYPSGDTPEDMNSSEPDAWPRHAAVGSTRAGVNGLFDMGGNVWEWLSDRRGRDALAAGGSWWYGPDKALAGAMQWKPAEFYAVYVGFRCAYNLPGN